MPVSSSIPSGTPSADDRAAPLPGARAALVLLLCMNMFNYIDRQVLAAVEPCIRASLLPDDPEPLARTKMGYLATAFLFSYMLTAPLFGLLAERMSRWVLIGVAVLLWSLASGASGLAGMFLVWLLTPFSMLLLTRCFVGVGEGAYGPIAPALLSDLYPVAMRGRVLSWFYMAIPVGGALGYVLGGQIGDLDRAHETWRWAFYVVVIPGLVLGLWALWMRDPPCGGADQLASPSRRAMMKDYLVLLRTPSYVFDTLGMTAMTFALGAIAFWMSDYLEWKEAPALVGLKPVAVFGAITALAGLLGTLAGGLAGDWLRGRFSGSYFLVSGAGLLISVPCLLLFLVVPFPWAWVFVFLAVLFLFFNTGPSNTILANVTHPSMRASAFALNILVIHTFGDAISPPLIGWIGGFTSRAWGFAAVSVFMFLGGVIWLFGARYLERDTQLAPSRLQ
jgi:MFS transporter, Spinster family, sphingosine-1-phosphate transporter